MSFKIHHGPPGSFKTSGAVMDDFLPCVKAGRVVVTNVRGLTLDRVKNATYPLARYERWFKRLTEPYKKVFPDVPESFDVIHLDTTLKADRERLAIWFHWAPKQAFFLIDEAQSVFSDRWAARDIAALDYPARSIPYAEACALVVKHEGDTVKSGVTADGDFCPIEYSALLSGHPNPVKLCGVDAAKIDGRPATWSDALEMHRHFGWDMTLTTPNIKSLRGDVREVSEGAYKHRNLGMLGLSGRYNEAFHDAQENGTPSQFISLVSKKISKEVWGLYDSTTTGTFSDTLAGIKLWKDPKILGLLAIVTAALFIALSAPLPAALGGKKPAKAGAPVPLVAVQGSPNPSQISPHKIAITGNSHPNQHVAGGSAGSGGGLAEFRSSNESPWQTVGYYRSGGRNFITLRRDGVTRTLVNPKDAKYDGNRVEVQLDGQLAASYTGAPKDSGSGVVPGGKF